MNAPITHLPALDAINSFLEALGLLNDGVGHTSNYRIDRLPEALDLRLALKQHFADRPSGGYSEASWHIRHTPLDRNWQNILRPILKHWFFEQHFSPLPIQQGLAQQETVNRFIEKLVYAFAPCELHEVFVTPPVPYAQQWQDFAIVAADGRRRWLLHLGFGE